MNISIGDLLTVEGEKYITLEVLNYEGKNYLFVNKTIDEEATQEFYIFEVFEDDSIEVVIENNLKQILMTKFEEMLRKDIEDLLNE